MPRGYRHIAAGWGDRIRAARLERGLSQDGVAALCPPYTRGGKTTARTGAWLGYIEKEQGEPSLSDLIEISRILQADVRWILTGEESGDSEFIARLRGIEPLLDERAKRTVLRTAAGEAEDAALPAATATPPVPPRRPTRQRLDDATEREIERASAQQAREAAASQRRAEREGRAG